MNMLKYSKATGKIVNDNMIIINKDKEEYVMMSAIKGTTENIQSKQRKLESKVQQNGRIYVEIEHEIQDVNTITPDQWLVAIEIEGTEEVCLDIEQDETLCTTLNLVMKSDGQKLDHLLEEKSNDQKNVMHEENLPVIAGDIHLMMRLFIRNVVHATITDGHTHFTPDYYYFFLDFSLDGKVLLKGGVWYDQFKCFNESLSKNGCLTDEETQELNRLERVIVQTEREDPRVLVDMFGISNKNAEKILQVVNRDDPGTGYISLHVLALTSARSKITIHRSPVQFSPLTQI